MFLSEFPIINRLSVQAARMQMNSSIPSVRKPLSTAEYMSLTGHDKIVRTPVTQEYLIEQVIVPQRHNDVPYDADTIFYDMIKLMVFKICHGFNVSIRGGYEHQDLEQECFIRLVTQLEKFSSAKAKFTTWSHRVCTNYLIKIYTKHKRRAHVFADFCPKYEGLSNADKSVEEISNHEPISLSSQMTDVIVELKSENPDKCLLIDHIFDRHGKVYSLPAKVNLVTSARETGFNYFAVKKFFNKVVRPKFKAHFGMVAV